MRSKNSLCSVFMGLVMATLIGCLTLFLPTGKLLAQATDFSIIVLGDTQWYTCEAQHFLYNQTNWIQNNKDVFNIQYVAHVGDIVNCGNTIAEGKCFEKGYCKGNSPIPNQDFPNIWDREWQVADKAFDTLETVSAGRPYGVPYGLAIGNHDRDSATLSKERFEHYFGQSRYSGRSYYGGGYPAGTNHNHYDLFSAGGYDFVVIFLEYNKTITSSDPALKWADDLLEYYSIGGRNRKGIIVFHEMLDDEENCSLDAPWRLSDVQVATHVIFEKMKHNANLFMMLCGHVVDGQAIRTQNNDAGFPVYTILTDFQERVGYPQGGGFMRIIKIKPSQGSFDINSYSPTYNLYLTDCQNQISNLALPNWGTTGSTVAVTSPNGGERWAPGTQRAITWNSSNLGSTVKIEYSSDNGGSYSAIDAAAPNNGVYYWTLPTTTSGTCLIRVGKTDGSVRDQSDAVFSVKNPLLGFGDNWYPTDYSGTGNFWHVAYANNMYVAAGSAGLLYTSADGIRWTTRASNTSYTLFETAWGNGKFITVGDAGTIISSANGTAWTNQTVGTTHLYGVCYANNKFVVIGAAGKIMTSSDGVSWTTRTSGVTGDLDAIVYGRSLFVVTGSGGKILTSQDGVTWTQRVSGTTSFLDSLCFDGNMFVAVGTGGVIVSSVDGISWTLRSSGTTATLYGVSSGNSRFAAVGAGGIILTSVDGAAWTPEVSGVSNDFHSVVFSGSRYVTVGRYVIRYSEYGLTSGRNWQASNYTGTNNFWNVAYGNGTYVSIGASGAVYTSTDRINWTQRVSGTTNTLYEAAYGPSQFVVVGNNGTILKSANGTAWTLQTVGTSHLYGVLYANNQYVIIGAAGKIMTSPDAVTWTTRTSGVTKDLDAIVWGQSKYVVSGSGGTILTSPNGITWTQQVSGVSNYLDGLAFNGTTFTAVGTSGVIRTSTDGITWTGRTSGISTTLFNVAWGNNIFVAVGDGGVILTSNDGINWVWRVSGATGAFHGVVFGDNAFVAAGVSVIKHSY